LQFELKGDGKVLVRLGESVKNFVTFMVYARNDVIEKRPETVRAFLAGLFDGIAYARGHREETIKICMEVLGHERAVTERLYDQLVQGYSTDGRFLPDSMAALARALKDRNNLDEAVIRTLYTDQFLPKR
jgi:ABC-type nitrate/sulfonate/bicarbonate transport system substrate-binding protein